VRGVPTWRSRHASCIRADGGAWTVSACALAVTGFGVDRPPTVIEAGGEARLDAVRCTLRGNWTAAAEEAAVEGDSSGVPAGLDAGTGADGDTVLRYSDALPAVLRRCGPRRNRTLKVDRGWEVVLVGLEPRCSVERPRPVSPLNPPAAAPRLAALARHRLG
jgi:hypothetical protein